MILSGYLIRAFVGRFVMLLVGLVLFLQTLDVLAQANEVLGGGGEPAAEDHLREARVVQSGGEKPAAAVEKCGCRRLHARLELQRAAACAACR